MNGRVAFPGETGAMIDCVVVGSAALSLSGVAGRMTERMTSDGDLNCISRAGFRMFFDR